MSSPRRHLSNPSNLSVIKAKAQPLIDIGIYRLAPDDVSDKMQLHIARHPHEPDNHNNSQVVHDCRLLNEDTVPDPWPIPTM